MKVQCVRTNLVNGHEYNVIEGKRYLVLGVSFLPQAPVDERIIYEILNDAGNCRGVPASLFEIVDGRCSRHWRAERRDAGELLLWPDEFYTEYFHDDLSEGLGEAVQQFRRVVERLASEFDETPSE